MRRIEDPSRTYHSNALALWMDHGHMEDVPFGFDIPVSKLRLTTGLPFSLHWIQGESGPQQGLVIAAVAGDKEELAAQADGPLVRMHSACIFSEVGENPEIDRWLQSGHRELAQAIHDRFDINPSLECDCRAQRLASQEVIAHEGGVYLDLAEQEGRGWGLHIKRQIYKLQREEGMDTDEACKELGIEFDVRNYDHVAAFLISVMGLTRVRLLSNNPRKIKALSDSGIDVSPVPIIVGVNEHNIDYLRVKRDKGGHDLPDDL